MSQVWLAIALIHIHRFLHFWHMSSADIQKLATGITFSTTFRLLTLFCSEVKWWKWHVYYVTVIASRERSVEHHWQGRWSMDQWITTVCMREGEWASFWTSAVNNRFLSLTRDIDIANLSVCLSVRLSVRNVPLSDENGLTYRHIFFRHTVAQSF